MQLTAGAVVPSRRQPDRELAAAAAGLDRRSGACELQGGGGRVDPVHPEPLGRPGGGGAGGRDVDHPRPATQHGGRARGGGRRAGQHDREAVRPGGGVLLAGGGRCLVVHPLERAGEGPALGGLGPARRREVQALRTFSQGRLERGDWGHHHWWQSIIATWTIAILDGPDSPPTGRR